MRSGTPAQRAQLTDEQLWMVHELERHVEEIIERLNLFGSAMKEQRLWSRCNRYSGQADFSVINLESDAAGVFDYKTGRVIVEPASTNAQLKTLAVLLYQNFSIKTAFPGIIQPRSPNPVTLCQYTEDDLKYASDELDALMDSIEKPDAQLTPGSWCDYCPAKLHCPALTGEQRTVISSVSAVQDTVEAVLGLSIDDLTKILGVLRRGRALFDAAEKRAISILRENPHAIPGWQLSEDTFTSSVEDVQKAFELLSGHMKPEEFASACKVKITELEKVFHKATGGISKKASKQTLRSILGPVIVPKRRSGSLQKASNDLEAAPVAIEDGE